MCVCHFIYNYRIRTEKTHYFSCDYDDYYNTTIFLTMARLDVLSTKKNRTVIIKIYTLKRVTS